MTSETELNPRTGEFRSRATELAYQTDQMHRDGRRITNAGFIAAALVFGFTVVDFGSLGLTGPWLLLLGVRALAALAVVTLALGFRRDPGSFVSGPGRRWIVLVEAVVLCAFLVVCIMRPDDVVTHSVSAVLMALVVTIFVPGTVRAALVVVGSFFASFIAVAYLRFSDDINLLALSSNLSATAVFAFIVVTVLNRSRRAEWLATLEQRRVNERLLDEARRAEELRKELERQATQDTLTGLVNRRAFFERGAQLIDSTRQSGHRAVAILMDVDGFKLVNDRFGHAAGDALLVAIGTALSAATRSDELVGRIGGEEFAVVAPVPSETDGLALAERLRSAVRETNAVFGHETFAATVSVGYTEVNPAEDLGTALARADRAMYGAKRSGGDLVLCDVA